MGSYITKYIFKIFLDLKQKNLGINKYCVKVCQFFKTTYLAGNFFSDLIFYQNGVLNQTVYFRNNGFLVIKFR